MKVTRYEKHRLCRANTGGLFSSTQHDHHCPCCISYSRIAHHLSTWVAMVVEVKEVEQEDWPINQGSWLWMEDATMCNQPESAIAVLAEAQRREQEENKRQQQDIETATDNRQREEAIQQERISKRERDRRAQENVLNRGLQQAAATINTGAPAEAWLMGMTMRKKILAMMRRNTMWMMKAACLNVPCKRFLREDWGEEEVSVCLAQRREQEKNKRQQQYIETATDNKQCEEAIQQERISKRERDKRAQGNVLNRLQQAAATINTGAPAEAWLMGMTMRKNILVMMRRNMMWMMKVACRNVPCKKMLREDWGVEEV
eukprot:scaffold21462_cov77-Attheya_sp.AAC.1